MRSAKHHPAAGMLVQPRADSTPVITSIRPAGVTPEPTPTPTPTPTTPTQKPTATPPTPTSPPTSASDSLASANGNMPPSMASSSNAPRDAVSPPPAASPDNYFRFTEKHERLLLAQARRHASALVVDALFDTSKWRFLTKLSPTSSLHGGESMKLSDAPPPQTTLQVFELKPQAILRVATIAPRLASDPQQLAFRSHTLLAKTRVRGKLDDFMAYMSSPRRAVHQGMMQTLHDHNGQLQHCDLFSSFEGGAPEQPQPLQQQPTQQREQFAIKYMVVDPPLSSTSSSFAASISPEIAKARNALMGMSTASSSVSPPSSSTTSSSMSATKRAFGGLLRRKATGDQTADVVIQSPQPKQHAVQQTHSSKQQPYSMGQAAKGAESIHWYVGEYATIKHGVRAPTTTSNSNSRKAPVDNRIGIISHHSVQDPELQQLCQSVANKTAPSAVSQMPPSRNGSSSSSSASSSSTSRTFIQFSGLIVYPVANDTNGTDDEEGSGEDEYLEVVIKLSCFDPRGLSPLKKAAMMSYIASFGNLAHMMLVMKLRASPYLMATHWVADDRRKCCFVCSQRFTSLRRRHHCRLCGEVTCARCSAVHQVRLVKQAKASLRICLLCVQGVAARPTWKESKKEPKQSLQAISQGKQDEENEGGEMELPSKSVLDEQEESESESTPAYLLDFSLVKDLSRKPQSPTSTATDTSSPVDPLMRSHSSSLSPRTSLEKEKESSFASSLREFHESASRLSFKGLTASHHSTKRMISDEVPSLNECDDDDEDDDEEEPQLVFEEFEEQLLQISEDVDDHNDSDDNENDDVECMPLSRIARADTRTGEPRDEEEEDDEDKRLQCLAVYRLLDGEVGGVIPEDLTLQAIVKEAAQFMDCAIAAIGFVDASRDMITATYSASPLCQVSRGVLPKQHSLTWEAMQRINQPQMGEVESAQGIVVLDTWKDPVLKHSPFVVDAPYVRFMVGLPIKSWTGVVIGALLVADIQPRLMSEITDLQLSSLTSHVVVVESWLETRRQEFSRTSSTSSCTSSSTTAAGVGAAAGAAIKMQDRLAEMLTTSYKTSLQMQGLQAKQAPHGTPPVAPLLPPSAAATPLPPRPGKPGKSPMATTTNKPPTPIHHVLF